jgi:hypothetical protein
MNSSRELWERNARARYEELWTNSSPEVRASLRHPDEVSDFAAELKKRGIESAAS